MRHTPVAAVFGPMLLGTGLLLTSCCSTDHVASSFRECDSPQGMRFTQSPHHYFYIERSHRNVAAAAPYDYYPTEYYILRGHPSQYYYTYPDRYYARRYRYLAPAYQAQPCPSPTGPGLWNEEPIYGYREPQLHKGFHDEHR